MRKIKTINIFDFDETFVRAPSYTGKHTAEKSTPGLIFNSPYEYYDHPTSLNEDLHNIQIIEPVYLEWKKSKKDEFALTVLITHRINDLKNEVIQILNKREVIFDKHYFLGRVRKKTEVLKKLLEDNPEVKIVRVFEDSVQQLEIYQKFFKEEKSKVKLQMYIVDKSRMYRLNKLTISKEIRIKLI